MSRATVEYLVVVLLGLALAYAVATTAANAVTDSFNQAGDLIGNSITYHD